MNELELLKILLYRIEIVGVLKNLEIFKEF